MSITHSQRMQRLTSQLEALLFVAARALTVTELAAATEAPSEDVVAALELLQAELATRGVRLVRSGASAELAAAPDVAPLVERWLQAEARTPLSKPALETLAIIVHRQPVTKQAIEEIRGIATDQTLRTLLGRGLIEEAGRSPEPGRPPLFGTTTALLRQLGISSLEELPATPATGTSTKRQPSTGAKPDAH